MFRPHEMKWDAAAAARLWDFYAENEPYRSMYFSRVYGEGMIRYLSRKAVLRGREVLDFGSGPGYLFEKMLQLNAGAFYTGADFSQRSIAALTERFSGSSFFRGACLLQSLPAPLDRRYDVVLLCEVVEHLEDEHLEETLAEVKRLLAPGGLLFVTTPNREELSGLTHLCPECGCLYHQWQHVRSWSSERLENWMASRGFATVCCEEVHFGNLRERMKHHARTLLGSDTSLPHLVYLGRAAA